MREKLAQQGYEGIGNSPEDYEKFMREEIARWAKVIKDSGTKIDP
jgi:tripartite-type tricarboxylate transporter receptor subunit TctC